MLLRVLCCVVYATAGVCASAAHCNADAADSGPVTCSPSGVFRGSWMESRRGRRFQAYRGIHYADPPIGELRFQPPRPILSYGGVVNASAEGPACPQPAAPGTYIAEDCLTLNVYTPNNDDNKSLPVVLYIHPGGFYSGSGRGVVAGPHYLLDRDLVLVTINYRLGSLGFLSMGDKLAPGNNGFKDQVAALKWVQRNIAAFGGDPTRVTIAGCSAGSISVMLHMISPMSKGLFHRAISMSGSPTSKVPSPSHRMDLAIKQANIVQCPTNTTNEMLIECLKTKTWQELAGSLLGFFEFGFDPLSLWKPVVEPDFGQERFLPIEPMDAIRQGKIHAVPYIISQTRDEFFWKTYYVLNDDTLRNTMDSDWNHIAPISFILPRDNSTEATRRLRLAYLGDKPLANEDVTADELGKLYGDSITGFPVHRLANLMCRHSSQPVYYYLFNYIGNHSFYEDPISNKPRGVAHHDDLVYEFSMPLRFPDIQVSDSLDSQMVDKMTALWYNFARYGDPNPRGDTPELESLVWPVMKSDQRNYLRVDKQLTVHQNLFEDRFNLWEELYPTQY